MSRRYNLAAFTGPQRLRPRPPWMPQALPVHLKVETPSWVTQVKTCFSTDNLLLSSNMETD